MDNFAPSNAAAAERWPERASERAVYWLCVDNLTRVPGKIGQSGRDCHQSLYWLCASCPSLVGNVGGFYWLCVDNPAYASAVGAPPAR